MVVAMVATVSTLAAYGNNNANDSSDTNTNSNPRMKQANVNKGYGHSDDKDKKPHTFDRNSNARTNNNSDGRDYNGDDNRYSRDGRGYNSDDNRYSRDGNEYYGNRYPTANNPYWARDGRYGYPGGTGSCNCCGSSCGRGYASGNNFDGYYNGNANKWYGERELQQWPNMRYRDNSVARQYEDQNSQLGQNQSNQQNQYQPRNRSVAMNDVQNRTTDLKAQNNSLKGNNRNDQTNAALGQAVTDDALIIKVRNALQADGSLSPQVRNIQIAADSGKVTLIGTVANQTEKSKVEADVKAVNGVKSVSNNLVVK